MVLIAPELSHLEVRNLVLSTPQGRSSHPKVLSDYRGNLDNHFRLNT